MCAAHERLLTDYHGAWREALQVRSREQGLGPPRRSYLGRIPYYAGSLVAFGLIGWHWSWSVPSDEAGRREHLLRTYQQAFAGHTAGFVRRLVGGHISRRLEELRQAYVQLAHSPSVAETGRRRFEELARECEELGGAFPAWRSSLRGAIPVLGLALGPTLAVLAVDGAWQVLLTVVVSSYVFVVALLVSAFESFRLKRELLFPGARQRELRRDASPPADDERNAYWREIQLHRALGLPARHEVPLDYALGVLIVASIAAFAATPLLRALPDDTAANVAVTAVAALAVAGVLCVNLLARHRFWR